MVDSDYMSMISTVADTCCIKADLSSRITAKWHNIEVLSKAIGYDILCVMNENNSVRTDIRQMIQLLYENSDPDTSAKIDCDQLRAKNAAYGGSWCKRGGQGAFMMLARKY